MSYDLDLYTAKAAPLVPPEADEQGAFNIDPPALCEDDDIPPDVLPILGKRRRWLHRLYIEGRPGAEAMARFEKWLTGILAETNGILIDMQTERFQGVRTSGPLPTEAAGTSLPPASGIVSRFLDRLLGRFASPQPATSSPLQPELGKMSFFFEDLEAFHAEGLARVLDVIARVLPEAMPTRFGSWEPLQGRVQDGDVGPLLAEFAHDPDLSLKAKAPFAHIFMYVACEALLAKWHPSYFLRAEFLVGRLTFELRPKALDDPRLLELMRDIALAVNAFYAEIRDHDCPVKAWFWYGLPKSPVRAFVLGPPYTQLWPEAASQGVEMAPGMVLVAPTRLSSDVPTPPDDLADPGVAGKPGVIDPHRYAKVFPFDVPGRR
ncbi:hypothetical protein EF888_09630 [Silicimonas algicola]|uniref:Uncharacterized protein n=1 Tax=Silicimonas algicola TaxID=1826607 RepID=A0A316G889_9RHOB|nr:hypothetical protein [Silicimonas algicola]AZQ67365.1 hypothetical protein EF888_09630 [Silicimonas algicola]PWK57048.1 hypothetical protein C8D95_103285 [Silicimonas algicola]